MKINFSLLLLLFLIISCSDSPTKSTKQVEYISRFDYEFVQQRYFFIDEVYRNRLESGYSDDLQQFSYLPGKDITQLEVWISINANNVDARKTSALINPKDYENIDDIPYEWYVQGTFKPLNTSEFGFDPYRGFFWVNESVSLKDALAIAYRTSDGEKFGTLTQDDTSEVIILRLIKNKFTSPSDTTWALMMRNVYDFGDSLSTLTDFNIKIENHINEKPYTEDSSYLSLLGLDILDENQDLEPDGNIDNNLFFLDKEKGLLITPGLHPFDPLPDSRFQLNEDDRVDIYYTISSDIIKFQGNSKFKISVRTTE